MNSKEKNNCLPAKMIIIEWTVYNVVFANSIYYNIYISIEIVPYITVIYFIYETVVHSLLYKRYFLCYIYTNSSLIKHVLC